MSLFPTRIILATDGSEDATLAALTAADIADKTGSELHVVHVLHTGSLAQVSLISEDEILAAPDPKARMEEAQEELFDYLVKPIEGAGGEVAQKYLRSGRRADVEIVALAEEIDAGLIVVGSRGYGKIGRALMGSISDSVVRHAHCPVLVVRK